MSIEIPMRREGSHLVPADSVAAEMMAEVPINTGVMVTVRVPRNLRQFRLAWALADIVSKSVDFLHDREDAMTWLKIKARHVRMIHDPIRNVTAIVPKSIAFASLDQVSFRRVLDRMIFVTTTEIIPGLEEGTLRAELESIVGIEPAPEPPKPRRAKKSDDKATLLPPAEPSDPPKGGDQKARADQDLEPGSPPSNRQETSDRYIAAARRWISEQTDYHAALDYLDSEGQIARRAAYKLSVGENKMIRRELAQHFERC